jgi:transcriptional antiterminator NusG
MAINDNTWFLVRETTGIGDFTGAAGKPTPMLPHEIEKILKKTRPPEDDEERQIVSVIKFKEGDRVRVTDGTFQNLEGEVDTIDESRGRIVVMLSVFNRRTPVELEHWQVEDV